MRRTTIGLMSRASPLGFLASMNNCSWSGGETAAESESREGKNNNQEKIERLNAEGRC